MNMMNMKMHQMQGKLVRLACPTANAATWKVIGINSFWEALPGPASDLEPVKKLCQEVKRLKEDLVKTRKELKDAQQDLKPKRYFSRPIEEVACVMGVMKRALQKKLSSQPRIQPGIQPGKRVPAAGQ